MKKSILAVIVLLLIIATLPIIGNTFVKNSINERLLTLQSFGLAIHKDKSTSSYLSTHRHFEIVLKDSKKFIAQLNQYSEKQIPPYVNAILEGATFGVDVKYSNLPFAKAFEVEFYPLRLSKELELSLKKNDMTFYNFTEKFLQTKGILYHINYNLLNDNFDGYIKDIDEKYKLQNGVDMKLIVKKATFKGNGELLAPTEFVSKVDELRLDAGQKNKDVHIFMHKLSTSSSFDSHSTYVSSVEIQNLEFNLNGMQENTNIVLQKLRVNASSNDQGSSVELNSKSSIETLIAHSNNLDVNISKFNFDISLNGLDKLSFEAFRTLASQSNTRGYNPQEMQKSMLELLSKGMLLKVADFSFKNIKTTKSGNLKGFSMNTTITLKKDEQLLTKMKISPLLALSSVDVLTNVRLSEEMFNFLAKRTSMLTNLYKYAKQENGDLLFNMSFIDSKLAINGKPLQ